MRILSIVELLGPGGTERAAQNCSLWYAAGGHQVAVLAHGAGGPRRAVLEARQIPVFAPEEGGDGGEAIARAVDWGPEIVHLHRPGLADARIADILRRLGEPRGGRLPVVETNHFARADRSDERRRIDVHLQLSRWCLWKWSAWSRGLQPRPLGVLMPHMVDTAAFFPAPPEEARAWRDEQGIPQDALVFGRLGQPAPPSWSPLALRAFAEVAADRPEAYLVVMGLPDAMQRHLARLPRDIRARIVTPPFAHGDARLRTIYSALDVFLHASACGESFGFVLVESMLCGTPVITLSTPLRGNSQLEVVGHERGGLVVNGRRSMVAAMRRLLDDGALRERLAAQGRRHVLDSYALERVGPRLVRVLELAKEHHGRGTLRQAVEADAFVTSVDDGEIDRLLHNSAGRVHFATRTLLRASHVPAVHSLIVRLKRLVRS